MGENSENKDIFSRNQIMTPKEAAKYLSLHPITIYRLAKTGKLPGFKVGGQWRFKKNLLDAWIKNEIKENKSKNDGRGEV
jgi:excisionase family DNA binding protein